MRKWILGTLLAIAACGDGSAGGADSADGDAVAETGRLEGITRAHNRERAMTGSGVSALRWDAQLAGAAQAWADRLASRGCQLQHSSSGYGENLFWTSGRNATAEQVVGSWVSEKAGYRHGPFGGAGSCGLACGHYTQVVWAASRRLGCGMGSCAGGAEIWVCNYDPPGNVLGQLPFP
jgi:uncharacterized protein YkwD